MATSRLPKFQEKFKELRGNLTQAQFADKLGLSRPTIGLYESGARIPDAEVLQTIALRCGVTADYLLGREDEPTHDLDFVCKYTGLSAQSIEVLRNIPRWDITGADAKNDLDYFITNCGEELAFHLSEIRHRRSRAAIEKGELEKSPDSSNRFQMSMQVSGQIRDIELALFSFSEFCREIPVYLYDTSKLLKELRVLYEQLHKFREQEGKDDGQ